MNLEQFATQAGVIVERIDVWGGHYSYTTKDDPYCIVCGFRTKTAAYNGWLTDTFGVRTAKAVRKLIKDSEHVTS